MSDKWNSPKMKVLIKGRIRQSFKQTIQFKKVMNAARREFEPKLKKDGTPGKRKQVRYECNNCKNLFPQKWVQVDHIQPSVPLDRHEVDMTYDELAEGIICDESNLQVLCSTPKKFSGGVLSCHNEKTNVEKFMRSKIEEMKLSKTFTKLDNTLISLLKLEYQKYLVEKELLKISKNKRKRKK